MKNKDDQLRPVERRALTFVRNRIAHFGRAPSVRELSAELGFQSPRSGSLILERLIEAGYIRRGKVDRSLQILRMPVDTADRESTVEIPLVGSAPCGTPLLAHENISAMIPVSLSLARPGHRYFLLRATGDSMTEVGIQDGAIVLVRQQPTAENGSVVVALVDDEATIKEFRKSLDAAVLVPRTRNKSHKPIVLRRDFQVQGVVIATLPNIPD